MGLIFLNSPTGVALKNGVLAVAESGETTLLGMGSNLTIPTNLTATLAPTEAPIASFSYKQGTTWQDVEFLDLSLKQPTEWEWKIDGVVFSTSQNPKKTGMAAGTYTIRLTVTNMNGSNYTEQTITIVRPPEIQTGYSMSKTSVSLKVSFQASAINGTTVTSWLWTFPDGTTSPLQNPTKTFTKKGTYIVTVKGSNATSSATRTITIKYA